MPDERSSDDDTLTACPDDGSALSGAPEVPATHSDSGLGGKATWNPSQDQLAEIQQTVAAITVVRSCVVATSESQPGAIVVSRL